MENLFYVNYEAFGAIKDMNTPVGVIIDTDAFGQDKMDKFMKKLNSPKEKHHIEKVIIRTKLTEELLANIIPCDNVYYQFTNEDEHTREIIYRMEDEKLRSRFIGNNICKTGIDILSYRIIGISNIMIGSPIINSRSQLEMLEKIGYTLFAIPNHLDNLTNAVSNPNWIRPEAIKFYPNINNWILSTDSIKPATAFRAYNSGIWLGKLSDVIDGFDNEANPHKDMKNFLIPTFDIKRTTCRGECLSCQKCQKEFVVNNLFTEKKEKGDN